jgi:hypothetical protein
MSIVTVEEFKKYANKRAEDTAGEELYGYYVEAAAAVVSDFLGFSPEYNDYVHSFYGDGVPYLALKARPVELASVTVAGLARTISDFIVEDEIITEKNGVVFPTGALVIVRYAGGWDEIPGIIKVTILEIAALFAMEAGENIGVTGTSFDSGSTRTFTNYTRFDKYLHKLTKYRVVRLPRMRP